MFIPGCTSYSQKLDVDKVQVQSSVNFEFKSQANNPEPTSARKRKFPGPAGALPKLVGISPFYVFQTDW